MFQRYLIESSWSVTDDWNGLSEAENSQSNSLFGNLIQQVDSVDTNPSAEDQWLHQTIDAIQQVHRSDDSIEMGPNDLSLSFEDDMDNEIAMLVRCNQSPQSFLVQEGKTLPPLTDEEKFHPSQLVERFVDQWVPTRFLERSVATVFETHATPLGTAEVKIMGPKAVASWFQQCTQPTQAIGPHDQRVMNVLAAFSEYGTGYLTKDDMKRLYLKAIVADESSSYHDLIQRRSETIKAVWRDFRNHGIVPPCEAERMELQKDLMRSQPRSFQGTLMDECELAFEKQERSSHEMVELAYDNKTPLYINDGDFVFIDEDSCIGCTHCALAAPGSFEILSYDGRARTFTQRPKSLDIVAAVATCPVDCMHFVSYDELKELEIARDVGDGRQDHKHFGTSDARGYVERKPLHVQRRESDANHRSSWYHYLKDKCCKSLACPQRGCFDCPSFKLGTNPYFKRRVIEATRIRAQHFIDIGIANSHRRTCDL